jgi:hypothetical protein
VHGDGVELVRLEQTVAANGLVDRSHVREGAAQVAGEDHVDDVLRPQAPLGRDRLHERDRAF